MFSFPISTLNACSGVNARTSCPQKGRNLRLRYWRSDRPAYSEKIIPELLIQHSGTRERFGYTVEYFTEGNEERRRSRWEHSFIRLFAIIRGVVWDRFEMGQPENDLENPTGEN